MDVGYGVTHLAIEFDKSERTIREDGSCSIHLLAGSNYSISTGGVAGAIPFPAAGRSGDGRRFHGPRRKPSDATSNVAFTPNRRIRSMRSAARNFNSCSIARATSCFTSSIRRSCDGWDRRDGTVISRYSVTFDL